MDLNHGDPRIIDITSTPKLVSFSFYSPREISRIASVEIFCPVFFNNKGQAIKGGLFDERMGPETNKKWCPTCIGSYSSCPGHFGFIDLALPLMNPFLKNLFLLILKGKCWYCGFFRIPNWQLKIFWLNLIIIESQENFDLSKEKESLTEIFSFFRMETKKSFSKTLENLISFENHYEKSSKKNLKKKGKILLQLKKKKRGESWCNLLSFFLEKCREEIGCKRCERSKVELKKLEEFRYSSQNEIRIFKKISFHRKIESDTYENRAFSYEKRNSSIVLSKSDRFHLKSFQTKEEVDFLWKYESEFCELVWGSSGNFKNFRAHNSSHIFFLNNILVPPNRFRPMDFSKISNDNSQTSSNPQNFYFIQMIKLNQQILLAIGTRKEIFSENWGTKSFLELEKEVIRFYDNSSSGNSKDTPIGVRQQLEKKTGLFRMHLMGKRVFHSARSIIIPDPFLGGNEVGVPFFFAEKLTTPEYVNFFNLRKQNFKKKSFSESYPFFWENFQFFQTFLGKKFFSKDWKRTIQTATLIEICFKYFYRYHRNPPQIFGLNKFFRYLKNLDLVLLNRQPSLHRVSIMAHKVKIYYRSKCIRIHYANCHSYNADFDGDEMNLHFPQNLLAKAEGLTLSLASNQGKVPTDNLPIRGLIQDHIIMAVFLTKRDTFFNKNIFSQLLNFFEESNVSELIFPCPAIIKPKNLWTGKQLVTKFWEMISTKISSFFFESRTKISSISLGNDETKVLIRKGQFLRGILDGSQLGKNKHGVLSSIFEIFGSSLANNFLNGFSRILTFFQRVHGHSTNLDDLIFFKKMEKQRARVFGEEKTFSRFFFRKILSKKGIFIQLPEKKVQNFYFFAKVIAFLCSRRILFSEFMFSIKNLLSQAISQNLEICIPGGLEKKFLYNGFSKMTISGAKGSLVNTLQVCLSLGQTELEGRCIPRGFTGKTLPCFPPFDSSSQSNGFIFQRFLTGINQSDFFFHCMAGREGLLDTAVKTSQSGYIQRSIIKHLEGQSIQYDCTTRFGKGVLSQLVYSSNLTGFSDKELHSLSKWFFQNTKGFFSLKFPILVGANKVKKYFFPLKTNRIFWNFTYRLWGIEEVQKLANEFFKLKRKFSSQEIFNFVQNFIYWTFSKNLFEPGEPVGLITGQSLGEPCTQMTLNTFHFAGKLTSGGNVGISRLKEILMTASKRLQNPTMSAKLKGDFCNDMVSSVEKRFSSIFLNDITETVTSHVEKAKNCDLLLFRIKLYSKNTFKHQLGLKTRMVLKKFQDFWEKIENPPHSLEKLNRSIRKRGSQKAQKEKVFINQKTYNPFVQKKFSFFSKLSQVNFNIKIKKNNKKKDPGFLEDRLFSSDFCVRYIPRISSCFVDLDENSVHIQGINFYALWQFEDIIDVNKIFSNDIFAVMVTYGIEGARNFIFKELLTVFQFQAISVAKRHLDLAADYMTRLGNYRAFNRQGLKEENGFQKITYETAIRFMVENAIFRNSEDFSSVSGCVGFGKVCRIGTGFFDLLLS